MMRSLRRRRADWVASFIWTGAKGARRDQAGRDVGVVQGIELRPQHVALEAHGGDGGLLRLAASWRGA